MSEAITGKANRFAEVVLLDVHVKRVQLEPHRLVVDEVEEAQTLLDGVEHERLEAVEQLEAEHDPKSLGHTGNLGERGRRAVRKRAELSGVWEVQPRRVGHASQHRRAQGRRHLQVLLRDEQFPLV